MTISWISGFARKTGLQLLVCAVIGAASVALAGPARAETIDTSADLDPPAVVVDAELASTQIAAYIVYVPYENEVLAVDSKSGAIRAVMPAPRPATAEHPTFLSALAAGSITIPNFGIILAASAFLAMIGALFLRRAPTA